MYKRQEFLDRFSILECNPTSVKSEDVLSWTESRPLCKLLFDHSLFRNMTVIPLEICLIGVVSSQNISHATSTSWLAPKILSLPRTASSTSLSMSSTAKDSRALVQLLTISSCTSRGITSLKTETVFTHGYLPGTVERLKRFESTTLPSWWKKTCVRERKTKLVSYLRRNEKLKKKKKLQKTFRGLTV